MSGSGPSRSGLPPALKCFAADPPPPPPQLVAPAQPTRAAGMFTTLQPSSAPCTSLIIHEFTPGHVPLKCFTRTTWFASLMAVLCIAGCANQPHGPYTTPSSEARNPIKAEELTLKAADLMNSDPAKAEDLLKQ